MLKRQLLDAGLPDLVSPHSFRVTVVTDLLTQETDFNPLKPESASCRDKLSSGAYLASQESFNHGRGAVSALIASSDSC
jgi:hypothetical protein